MLRLSDDELDIIQTFARPLHPDQRGAYLKRVAALLDGKELGEGAIHRACEMAQLEYRSPAAINGRPHTGLGKYSR
jgi:hypothetical protein